MAGSVAEPLKDPFTGEVLQGEKARRDLCVVCQGPENTWKESAAIISQDGENCGVVCLPCYRRCGSPMTHYGLDKDQAVSAQTYAKWMRKTCPTCRAWVPTHEFPSHIEAHQRKIISCPNGCGEEFERDSKEAKQHALECVQFPAPGQALYQWGVLFGCTFRGYGRGRIDEIMDHANFNPCSACRFVKEAIQEKRLQPNDNPFHEAILRFQRDAYVSFDTMTKNNQPGIFFGDLVQELQALSERTLASANVNAGRNDLFQEYAKAAQFLDEQAIPKIYALYYDYAQKHAISDRAKQDAFMAKSTRDQDVEEIKVKEQNMMELIKNKYFPDPRLTVRARFAGADEIDWAERQWDKSVMDMDCTEDYQTTSDGDLSPRSPLEQFSTGFETP